MIPVSSRLANILSRLNRAEFDEMFQRIGPNTYRIKQPLYLEPSTNPSLAASRLSTQNTQGVYVYEGVRRTSRKEIYIDLNAGRGYRPKMYISNGSHIVKTSDAVPETINPITLEQRGHILRIKQSLYLEPSTNPSLAASRLSTQNTQGVYVYEGVRRTSRKEIYIDLNAGRGYRPKMYISNGSHIVKTSDAVPETINPITLEQRGHILRIKQSKKPRYIDEGNRRRRDIKARRYRQLLRFVNQTYGRYSDVKDIAEAWENTQSLSGFVEAVAVNEALDRVYAKRSELIRQRVYEPLNIGGTPLALRTAWKLWAPARSYGP